MYKMILQDYRCHIKSSFKQMYNNSGFVFAVLVWAVLGLGYDDNNNISYILIVFPSLIAYMMSRMYGGLLNKTFFLCPLDANSRRQYAIDSFRLRVIIPSVLFLVGNIIAMLFGCFSIGVFWVRLFVFGCTAVSVNIYAQPHNSKDRPNTKVYPFVGNFEVVEVYSHMINIVLTIIVIAMNEYSITMLSTWELIILAIALIIQLSVTISMVKRFYWQSIVLMEFYK